MKNELYLAEIKTPDQAVAFAEGLIAKAGSAAESWAEAEAALASACAYYLADTAEEKERTMANLAEMVGLAEAKEDDEDYLSPLDMLFFELETGMVYVSDGEFVQKERAMPEHFAVRQYREFKRCAPSAQNAAAAALLAVLNDAEEDKE